jgi:hypothetical protein
MDARPEAVRAAQTIVKDYGITGLVDPEYIANLIENELKRFEGEPDAPLIEPPFQGPDVISGLTMDELTDAAKKAIVRPAAQAAAIRVVRAYGSSVGDHPNERYAAVINLARSIEQDLKTIPPPSPAATALAQINRHRRSIGQAPLDPVAADWSEQDILAEARRLEERGLMNPVAEIKRRMLAF